MAKCSQCLHWDACSMLFEMAFGRKPTANGNKAEEKCPHFKDKTINTNADRIRAMSDDGLAAVLMEACAARELCGGCPAQNCSPKCPGESYGAWEEWLKQPAEG